MVQNSKNQNFRLQNQVTAKLNDLLNIKWGENSEPLVLANKYDDSILMVEGMNPHQPQIEILVRDTVAKKLATVQDELKSQFPELSLMLGFGYRSPKIQKEIWDQKIAEIRKNNPGWSEEDIIEETNRYIAHPEVAGHQTGGCVDITIADGASLQEIDMGAKLDDLSQSIDLIKTYSSKISKEQLNNRLLLHDLMVKLGFMPFYDEYWHFMYGDKEWAFMSGNDQSLYSPII